MSTRWACTVVAMICCQLGVVAPVYAEDMPWLLYRNDQYGFELRLPPNFVPGTYKRGLPPNLVRELRDAGSREPFEEAIVLVDRARAGLRDLSALPPGEIRLSPSRSDPVRKPPAGWPWAVKSTGRKSSR